MNTLARPPRPRTSRAPGHAPGPFGPFCTERSRETPACAKPLAVLQAFGQGGGDPGLDRRLAVRQPRQVLGGELQQPARFGAANGGEPSVAVAAAPVARGELAEVVAGAVAADEPGVDEDVVAPGQDDVEEPVRVPAADDLLTGGDVTGDAAGLDGPPGRGGQAGQQRDRAQHIRARG